MDLLRGFQSFLEKFYLSLKTLSLTSDSSQESSQNPQTLHHSSDWWSLLYIFLFSIQQLENESGLWGFIALICSPACTSPTGDWYLETSVGQKQFEFWRSWKTHQLCCRSMWINISHNPEALESRTGKKKKKETDTGKRKNQLVESFAKKRVGRHGGWGDGGWGGGLSGWVNNEACFQCFKGRGEKAIVKLCYGLGVAQCHFNWVSCEPRIKVRNAEVNASLLNSPPLIRTSQMSL